MWVCVSLLRAPAHAQPRAAARERRLEKTHLDSQDSHPFSQVLGMTANRCACPQGWPRLFEHEEDGPVVVVRHGDDCPLSSVRVSGVYLPTAVYEQRLADAVGEKRAVAMEEPRRG